MIPLFSDLAGTLYEDGVNMTHVGEIDGAHVYAVAREYPSVDASQAVYDRCERDMRDASIVRGRDEHGSRYFVAVLATGEEDLQGFDWGDGVPVLLTARQIEYMARTRVERLAYAVDRGDGVREVIAHYDDPDTAPRMRA